MESTVFDFAIIGAGAAGLNLATALSEDPYFQSKKILILEKSTKETHNPTWCFWEKESGKWNDVVDKTWNKTAYITQEKKLVVDLGAYTYKMVHGNDFYKKVRERLINKDQITWIDAEVKNLERGAPGKIITGEQDTFLANHVFDSRIDKEFFKEASPYIYLKQHFVGWVIETKKAVFDPEIFTMMDYRLVYPGTTSFMYILPLSTNKALLEFTFFSPDHVEKEVYESYLKKYIKDLLQIEDYTIIKKEGGVIPMTDYPFHQSNNEFVTKIGTAGGWVKGSTGYSFKNAERKSNQIIANIKKNRQPGFNLTKKRFRLYDSLFLDVLYNHNDTGPQLFNDMYYKNDIELILSFLDEETTFLQELRLMNTFDKRLFTKAILKRIF